MADISIIAEGVRFTDGHVKLGVAAGDHAAMLWPMMCGLAKARYYLLTSDFIEAEEAERIGLVSKCVPADQLMDDALALAARLAAGPQTAIRFTKRSLNHWIRNVAPIFENSLALEILNFFGPDIAEGHAALVEKRVPQFPSGARAATERSCGLGVVEPFGAQRRAADLARVVAQRLRRDSNVRGIL